MALNNFWWLLIWPFLFGEAADGIKGLLGVPGTLFPQGVHDVQEPAKGFQFLFSGVHVFLFAKGVNHALGLRF